jgi:hypothetical protein
MFITREQVKELILLEMGVPGIDVELKLMGDNVSPMNHLDKAINETLELYFRHNTNESIYQTWIYIQAVPNQSIYPMPNWIESVVEVWASTGGILQSPFMMLDSSSMETVVTMSANFNEWDIVSYTAARLFASEVMKAVGEQYYPKLIVNAEGKKELHITPPPRDTGYARAIVGRVYRRAELGAVYGHPYFVKITAGALMKVWGRVLGKYEITLPGGGKVNWAEMKRDGKEMYDEFLEKLISESAPPLGAIY